MRILSHWNVCAIFRGVYLRVRKSRLDKMAEPYREYADRLQSRYKKYREIFIKALESGERRKGMSTLRHELQPSDGPPVVLLSPLFQERGTRIAAVFSEQSTAQNEKLRELLDDNKQRTNRVWCYLYQIIEHNLSQSQAFALWKWISQPAKAMRI